MGRATYNLGDDEHYMVRLMVSFATINGEDTDINTVLNKIIRDSFERLYEQYSKERPEGDFIRQSMEKALHIDCQKS